jgi:SAM-dependent methyltransferase
MNRRFRLDPRLIETTIEDLLARRRHVRVLEIGAGEGRVLMQLHRDFPSVEFHGINRRRWVAMSGNASLKETAARYNIFEKETLGRSIFPEMHFYDASKLRFPDGYFDLIISQVSIHYVERKDMLLEEAWRVLRMNGRAFLHLDTWSESSPDYMPPITPRFLIYSGSRRVSAATWLKRIAKSGMKIRCVGKSTEGSCSTSVFIEKNTRRRLRLRLTYDWSSSFHLERLVEDAKSTEWLWGFRSVFRIPG